VVSRRHPLAGFGSLPIGDLAGHRLIARGHCENGPEIAEKLAEKAVAAHSAGDVASDQDMIALIDANLAIGILPQTVRVGDGLAKLALSDLAVTRTVTLYTVSGRARAPAATGIIRLLRAYDYASAIERDQGALASA
jgi:DNA-binding transcriptional LysR family regulator